MHPGRSVKGGLGRGGQLMAEVERIEESTANGVRAGAVVSTLSQAVQERE